MRCACMFTVCLVWSGLVIGAVPPGKEPKSPSDSVPTDNGANKTNSKEAKESRPSLELNKPDDHVEIAVPSLLPEGNPPAGDDPKMMREALEILRSHGSLLNGSELDKLGSDREESRSPTEGEENAPAPSRKMSLAAESLLRAARVLDKKGKQGKHQEKVRQLRQMARELLLDGESIKEIKVLKLNPTS